MTQIKIRKMLMYIIQDLKFLQILIVIQTYQRRICLSFIKEKLNEKVKIQILIQKMKVYSPSNNYKLDKIIFASKILGKNVQHVQVPFDHKNKQFIAQFPNYSLPALQLSQSSYVFGANSILLNLFEQKVSKLSAFEQAQIYQWLQLAEKQLQNTTGVFIVHQQKIGQISQQQINKAKQNIVKVLKLVDDRLKLRTYLVSHSITAADIVFFFNFRVVKETLQKQLKTLTSLKRWMANLQSIWAQVSQN